MVDLLHELSEHEGLLVKVDHAGGQDALVRSVFVGGDQVLENHSPSFSSPVDSLFSGFVISPSSFTFSVAWSRAVVSSSR